MAEPPVTDAQLIARVLVHDDRHAFSELVRRYQSAVRSTLRRLTVGNTRSPTISPRRPSCSRTAT